MATDIFLHGIETIENANGPRSVDTIDTGIIGAVFTAPQANPIIWPLNKAIPVYGYSGLPGALGSTGTGPEMFDGIFDQATRASQTILAVRIAEGATLAETMANAIGNQALKTGMHALRDAQADHNLLPKLLIMPGLTGHRPTDGIASVTVQDGGSGFTQAPPISAQGGGGFGFSAVSTINDEGELTEIAILNRGANYSDDPGPATGRITFTNQPVADTTVTIAGTTVTFKAAGAAGNQVNIGANLPATLTALAAFLNASIDAGLASVDYTATTTRIELTAHTPGAAGNTIAYSTNVAGATTAGATLAGGFDGLEIVVGGDGIGVVVNFTLGQVANPVVSEALGLAKKFRAGVIADGPNTTAQAAVNYRLDFNDARLFIVDPFAKVSKEGTLVNVPASPRVAGLQARIDYEEGFWVSPSNHVIEGIVGAARSIEHSLSDPSAESQYLNKNHVATIVRSPSGGFKLWGNRGATSDPNERFWSVRRSHDTIIDSVERAHEPFIDKPFGLQILVDIAETVNGALRKWQALGATLGKRVWLDPGLNTKETWVAGKLYVSYDAEAPAPIEHLIFVFNRNTGYYETLAESAIREIARMSGRSV